MSEFVEGNTSEQYPLGKDLVLRQYSLKEVGKHKTPKKAWVVFKKKVYDVTKFINFHPGGYEILQKELGTDITTLFNLNHGWVNFNNILEKYQVGYI